MLWFLLACTGIDDGPPHAGSHRTDPADHTAAVHTGAPGTPPADPDPAAAAAAVSWAVAFVAGLSMKECAAAYADLHDRERSDCPRFIQEGDPKTWDDDCDTPRGSRYRGQLTAWGDLGWYVDERLAGPTLAAHGPEVVPGWAPTVPFAGAVAGTGLDGEATVGWKDELDWRFVGQGWSLEAVDRGLVVRNHQIEGRCVTTRATGAPWVDDGRWVWLTATELASAAGDARWLRVDGAVSQVPVDPFETVSFVGVEWLETAATCALEPDGLVEVRDLDGHRWPLAFSADACDGCADLLRADGSVVGPVCADFTPFRTALPGAGG